METEKQVQSSFDDCESLLTSLDNGVKNIENQMIEMIAELKHLSAFNKAFQKAVKTTKPKDKKKVPKITSDEDRSMINYIVTILSIEKVFKEKLGKDENINRVKTAMEHDMFFNESDCNTVRIFSNGSFLNDNYLGFSKLDTLGFTKLINRFYSASEEYKGRYINDMVHNMKIKEYEFKAIESYLTSHLSNAVTDNKIKELFNSFKPSTSNFNVLPITVRDDLIRLTGVELDSKIIEGDMNSVCVPFEQLNNLLPVCIKCIKDLKKKLFFSYISLSSLKTLHQTAKIIQEDLPSIKQLASKVDKMDDVYVILTSDVDKMISLVKKFSKSIKYKLLEGESVEDLLPNGIETLEKENGVVVVNDKKFLNNIHQSMERTLELYINNCILDTQKSSKKEEEEESD